jgi:pantetheine-phosphate adenylyltransferase
MTRRIALFTGSFDPFTYGHQNVLQIASGLFDKIVIAIGVNSVKAPLLQIEQRVSIIQDICQNNINCDYEVISFEGLAIDTAKKYCANFIIRGLRDTNDFNYETQLSEMNATLAPDIQTVFLPSSQIYRHISSTLVRQIIQLGGDASLFVPPESQKIIHIAMSRN